MHRPKGALLVLISFISLSSSLINDRENSAESSAISDPTYTGLRCILSVSVSNQLQFVCCLRDLRDAVITSYADGSALAVDSRPLWYESLSLVANPATLRPKTPINEQTNKQEWH